MIIKRFVAAISFLLGIMVIITWLLQQQGGQFPTQNSRKTWVSIALLVITWGTPFLLFRSGDHKK